MSKFFEALEQAELERAREQEAARRREISPGRPGKASPGKSDAPHDRPATPAVTTAARQKPASAAPSTARQEPSHAAPSLAREESLRAAPSLAREESSRAAPSIDAPLGGLDDHLVGILNPASPEAEQYRSLCCALEQDRNLRVVGITSPGGGDGKTITAINVAATLSQAAENRVLLIDADLRHPSVAAHFGVDDLEQPGLIDAALNPELALEDVEIALSTFNLSIVVAGHSFDPPYETLKAPRLAALVQEARRRYDYVIVDTPPVVPVPDCRVIGRWVDGFVIVVAAHQTPRKLLEEALNIVEPEKVAGLVFNGDDVPLSRYYDYYYYASGRARGGNGAEWGDRLKKTAASSRTSFRLARR